MLTETPFQRLCEVIPGGVNSPVRSCKGLLDEAFIVEKGFGDQIEDINGKTFIDYCCSWGALIHGHAHPVILDAVRKRMEKGTSFGISTLIEERAAREVVSLMESVDTVRFVSSGTEAAMSAVRLARGYTGRGKIVKFIGNYHGHADYFLVKAGSGVSFLGESSSAGVPEESVSQTICIPYNDIESADKAIAEDVAAVILEPVAANMGVVPANWEFMAFLRKKTLETGSLLIFDEVVTGFRVGLKGAGPLYGVQPDLTCLGKVVGGGFNAAAFGGRREIMNTLAPLGPVYQAGTLSGNPVAMEAGLQALRLLQADGFYEELKRKTDIMTKPVQDAIQKHNLPLCLQQAGSMFSIFFGKKKVENFSDAESCDREQFARFFRHMFSRGVYIPPSPMEAWFVSSAHTDEHLEYTRDTLLSYLIP